MVAAIPCCDQYLPGLFSPKREVHGSAHGKNLEISSYISVSFQVSWVLFFPGNLTFISLYSVNQSSSGWLDISGTKIFNFYSY